MLDPSLVSAAQHVALGWEEIRAGLLAAALSCAETVSALRAGLDPDGRAVAVAERAVAELEASLRSLEFNEAVIQAERERAAHEALAAAGVPQPRSRHLYVIS